MASRSGRMVEGTDGGDHLFRERVAGQYQVSAKNKSRLKLFVMVHWMLGGVHLLRLLPADMVPIPPTPAPIQTEYLWLASLPFTLIAMSACRKSKVGGLSVFQFGVTGFGICVLLMTLFFQFPDTTQYLLAGDTKGLALWNGLPFPVLWSGFSVLCILVHILEISVARTLMAAWAPRHGKKN